MAATVPPVTRVGTAAAFLVLAAGPFSTTSAAEFTVDVGVVSAVAVSPDGRAVAAAIYGVGKDETDVNQAVVRWWNWNGSDGNWPEGSYRVSALSWAADGSLLVGGMADARVSAVPWWRLGAGGTVRAACRGLPLGPDTVRFYSMYRGVASIAELATGQVVTGGIDGSLAVWEGCSSTWLNVESCCYAENPITVIALGEEFMTFGEGAWQDEERGYKDLGPRRWSPSPWKAVVVQAPAVTSKLRVNGAECAAKIDASGHVVVSGAHAWTASIGTDAWLYLAASHDCRTLAAASERRIVTVTSP
jgi:hypothetical protein